MGDWASIIYFLPYIAITSATLILLESLENRLIELSVIGDVDYENLSEKEFGLQIHCDVLLPRIRKVKHECVTLALTLFIFLTFFVILLYGLKFIDWQTYNYKHNICIHSLCIITGVLYIFYNLYTLFKYYDLIDLNVYRYLN